MGTTYNGFLLKEYGYGMIRVGLTGGVACGKSAASQIFKQLGMPVIDADEIAKQLLKPHTIYSNKVIDHFGASILTKDDEIDRSLLRNIIFTKPNEKVWLEHLLHPPIMEIIEKEISHISAPYVIVVIPLLFEANLVSFVDRVCVIDCSLETQNQRLLARDHISLELANQMIRSQHSREDKLKQAHDVIDNSQSKEYLFQQIEKLHQKYLTLSQN